MNVIQIDSREKERAIGQIVKTFDEMDQKYIISKLYVGDYMQYGHPEIVVDRKQNVGEICGNMCSTQKDKDGKRYNRFREELLKAKEVGTKVVVLIEDDNYSCIDDVNNWSSPHTKIKGTQLAKSMKTMQSEKDKYNMEFQFCKKKDTGKKILEILGGKTNE